MAYLASRSRAAADFWIRDLVARGSQFQVLRLALPRETFFGLGPASQCAFGCLQTALCRIMVRILDVSGGDHVPYSIHNGVEPARRVIQPARRAGSHACNQ